MENVKDDLQSHKGQNVELLRLGKVRNNGQMDKR